MIVCKRLALMILPITALLLLISLPAVAQEDDLRVTEQQTIDYNDQQLEKVASAYISITEIRQELQEELATIEDQETARALQQQAGNDMVAAVEATGMEVDTYNEIVEEVQTNGDLRSRLMLIINTIK